MAIPLDELITWERGVHLRGTPLWIDPEVKRELAALTAVPSGRLPAHSRTLASPGVAAALARLGTRAPVLPAEIGRWVGIGGVQLQAVDLGAEPQGRELASAVLVGVGGRRILMAGALRRQDARWPAAEHVVARLVAPGHRGGDLHQVVRGLSAFVRQARADGESASIIVDAIDIVGVLVRTLAGVGIGVTVAGRLGRVVLGDAEPDPLPADGPSVTVRFGGGRLPARARIARVDTGIAVAAPARRPDATFRLKWFADPQAVARLVRVARATGLTLLGARDSAVRAVCDQVGPSVTVRSLGQPEQLSLGA